MITMVIRQDIVILDFWAVLTTTTIKETKKVIVRQVFLGVGITMMINQNTEVSIHEKV